MDCVLLAVRKREDAINPILAGTITGGLLAFRGGGVSMIKNAAIGGGILALMEISGLVMYMVQLRRLQRQAETHQQLEAERERERERTRRIRPSL